MKRLPIIFKRGAGLLLQHIVSNVQVGESLPTAHYVAELTVGRPAVRYTLARLIKWA